MTDVPAEHQPTTTGSMLRAARERKGLTLQETAQGLNLRPGIIEALEGERYDLLPPRTFVKGYLRAYAKLVGLQEYDILAAFEREHPEPDAERVRPAMSGDRQANGNGWLKWLVLLIALLLLAYAGYHSYVTRQTAPNNAPVADDLSGRIPPAAVLEPVPADSDVGSIEQAEPPALEAMAEASAPAEALPDESEPSAADDGVDETPEAELPLDEPAAEPALPTPSVPAAPSPAATAVLAFEVGNESWIEVTDATGARRYAALVQGPRTLEVSGRPPFRLVIGNAEAVRLLYGSEPVPLEPHTRRDVARLTVPTPD